MLYKFNENGYDHVMQKSSNDSAIACLSMLLREDYEIIYGLLQRMGWKSKEQDVSVKLMCQLIKEFGERPVMSFHLHPIPSIALMPCLNRRAKMHSVFVDGMNVLDPLWKAPFKNFYDFDTSVGEECVTSITIERFFEGGLQDSYKQTHTVPYGGFNIPADKEMEGIGKRMVKNMHRWDEREKPLNQEFKWQVEEMEKILVGRGIDVTN